MHKRGTCSTHCSCKFINQQKVTVVIYEKVATNCIQLVTRSWYIITHSTNQWLSAIRAPLSCISCLELGHILPTLVCPSLMTYSNISDSWGSSFRFTRLGSLLSTLKVMPAFCRRNLKYKRSRNGKTEFSLIKKFIQHIKNLKHFSLQF